MNPSNTLRLTRLVLSFAGLWAATATAVPVTASIDGLPPGLSTRIMASKISCNQSPPSIERFAGVPMTESTVVLYDYVVGLNGVPLLRPRTVTSYHGNMDISTRACSGGFTTVYFSVDVDGVSASGSTRVRNARVATIPPTEDPIRVVATVRGFSYQLERHSPPSSAGPFVQLTRGLFNRVSFWNKNPFGASSVAAPALEFVLPSPTAPRGFAVSTRLFITRDGQKCIRAQFTTRCQTSGTLSHGGVDLDVESTEHSGGGTTASSSTFSFRLSNSFPAGTYTLNASADDVDPFDYLVDGVPTSLDLLKWTPATQSVVVQ